ncbi:ABC transporter permease [Paenibacillus sp. strain BS8-2]
MFRIRDALQALRNRWVFSLLLLVQFTLGLSTMTGTLNTLYNLHYLETGSLLDLESTYLVEPEGSARLLNENQFTMEQVQGIYEKLGKHPDVIGYGTYYEDNLIFDDANQLDDRLIEELKISTFPYPLINTIVVDRSYYHLMDLEIKDGHGFTETDFRQTSKEVIPVLAGTFFKKYYEIGDVIKNQYCIIGFIPEGYLVNNNTTNVYLKQDKTMLLAMPLDRYNDYSSMFYRLHLGTVLKLQPNADLDGIKRILTLPGTEVDINVRSLGEEVRSNAERDIYIQIPQMVMGASFILFSIIGIVVTTLVSIWIRRREFGIKLAVGESERGIFVQIVMEILIIGMAGLGLAIAHFAIKYRRLLQISSDLNAASSLDIKIDLNILLSNFFILIATIGISSLILYPFIKKQELKSLIGGTE